MKKSRILLMLIVLAVAVAFVPATVSAAAKPKLNLTKVTLPVKTDGSVNFTYLWLKGTKKKVKWSTSNKKIVQIRKTNDKYLVTVDAKKKGKATITAKVGSKKYKCKVTVTKAMSRKALTKLISVDTSTVKDQYITFTNKSKYYLKAYWDFHLYDEEGYDSDWDEVFVHLKPGGSVKVAIRNPHQCPTLKFTEKSTSIDYEYHSIKESTAERQAETEDHYLPVIVTNKTQYNEALYYVTAFFKKDGKIVWAQQKDTDGATGQNINPGQSRTVKFYLGSVKAAYDMIDIQISKSSGSAFGGSND